MWTIVGVAIALGWVLLGMHLVRWMRRPARRPPPEQTITLDAKRQAEFSDRERH